MKKPSTAAKKTIRTPRRAAPLQPAPDAPSVTVTKQGDQLVVDLHQGQEPRVQRGPAFTCFICGAPCMGLRHWPKSSKPTQLDEWGDHIGYLNLTCKCVKQHGEHVSRVAVLGDFITPLQLPNDSSRGYYGKMYDNVQAVRVALMIIATAVPEDELRPDPARYMVYAIMTGHWTPEFAIQQVRQVMWPSKEEPK